MTVEISPGKTQPVDKELAPGITDPDEFQRLVDSNPMIRAGFHRSKTGKKIIGERITSIGVTLSNETSPPTPERRNALLTEEAVLIAGLQRTATKGTPGKRK
ncbi:MAG TPA: hypothetical protein VNA13_02595 [Xanthomonadales bacterium]|nr:hypothetical protein [Xanthomonadales bacterium]